VPALVTGGAASATLEWITYGSFPITLPPPMMTMRGTMPATSSKAATAATMSNATNAKHMPVACRAHTAASMPRMRTWPIGPVGAPWVAPFSQRMMRRLGAMRMPRRASASVISARRHTPTLGTMHQTAP
jgi:hypothetical protein